MTSIDLGLPRLGGLAGVPPSDVEQSAKDYKTDQEVRWCPGCGDYAVLAAVQALLPDLGLKRENIVFVSGIGCSSRFPYYVNTYGMHSIHGRAPAIATGLATMRDDLSVWVVTGDGDALSIGGNHLIHALRRNVNLTILLFNNRIYGLTKGQCSPTSEEGKLTKSTPMGSVDRPFNPVSLALGAEASFVGRALDSDRKLLTDVLRAAAEHRGSALVEIYQNCPIFNDGAFNELKKPGVREEHIVPLSHGQPIRFGAHGQHGVRRDTKTGSLTVAEVAEIGAENLVVHDATLEDPSYAFALSRLGNQHLNYTVTGVFRSVRRPTYEDLARHQAETIEGEKDTDIGELLRGKDTWEVSSDEVTRQPSLDVEPATTAGPSSWDLRNDAGSGPKGSPMTTCLPAFPAMDENPLDTCIRLREIAPVVEVAFPGGVPGYLALTHNAVREILAGDNKTFLRDPKHWPALHDGSIPEDWPLRAIVQADHLGNKDGKDHRRLRGLVGKAFTPGRVQAMEPRLQEIVDELLDVVVAGGDGIDLVPAFTQALPMVVICELFGVPEPERPRLRQWTSTLLAHTTPPEEVFATQNTLMAYLHELVQRKQRDPGDDLTSGLVQARDPDDKLTTDELVAVLWLMLVAGHETTVHLLGHAIVTLSQHPDQLALAKAENRWAEVVEETLRYRHPVIMPSWRYAVADVTISGVTIPKGSAVGVGFHTSGVDPERYGETANQFDITRKQTVSLGFAQGPRYCIGAPLARLESRLALASLYRRLPDLSLAIDPDDIPYSPSFFAIGPLSLPIKLGFATP